jgi:hypothetical protein
MSATKHNIKVGNWVKRHPKHTNPGSTGPDNGHPIKVVAVDREYTSKMARFEGHGDNYWNLNYFVPCDPPTNDPNTRSDPVHRPSHYTAPGIDVECMDVIQALGLDFPTGSALKYIWRHKNKGRPLQDLKKARENLERAIQQMEGAENEAES